MPQGNPRHVNKSVSLINKSVCCDLCCHTCQVIEESQPFLHQVTGACVRKSNEQSFLLHTSFGAMHELHVLEQLVSTTSGPPSVGKGQFILFRTSGNDAGISYFIFCFKWSAGVHGFDRAANATPSSPGVWSGKTHFHASCTEDCRGVK